MKVIFSTVGEHRELPNIVMDLTLIPREGDLIEIPNRSGDLFMVFVRSITWTLEPDDPHIYIVVGERRPSQ